MKTKVTMFHKPIENKRANQNEDQNTSLLQKENKCEPRKTDFDWTKKQNV